MFKDGLFRGKRILVTGGGTGLGRMMSERFLQLGAQVIICSRRKSVCDSTATALMDTHGGSVRSYGVDIRDSAAVDAMIEDIFNSGPLTDLVNNAAGNFIARTQDLSPRGFDAIANTVMHGTFYVTHAVGRRWISGGHPGNVVSIVATWVRNGGPFAVPSAMSKSAVQAMTTSLATEWARYGIRLNAIAPGEIPTEGMNARLTPGEQPGERTIQRNPMARVGEPEELQNLATFLLSGGCQWLTGETIAMDGGEALATGGNFFDLRSWSDERWQAARAAIQERTQRDKAARDAATLSDGQKSPAALLTR
jgi:NAD(P)-dependent dehydrogenase (short-subunit alcohol dehydrogenase family)